MSTWTPPSYRLPEEGIEVNTLDGSGHEQKLVYDKGIWWFPDRSMYVYYTPTFWQPLAGKGAPVTPPPADPTTGEALSEEERAELTQALRRAPNAAYLRLPGPVDIAGTFEPYLASAVEAILARRVASAVEEAERRGAEEGLREAAREFHEVMSGVWGGSAHWLTTGDHIGALVADILRDRADALASGRGTAREGAES